MLVKLKVEYIYFENDFPGYMDKAIRQDFLVTLFDTVQYTVCNGCNANLRPCKRLRDFLKITHGPMGLQYSMYISCMY